MDDLSLELNGFKALMENLLPEYDIPGAQVAISHKKVDQAFAVGYRDAELLLPMTTDTPVRIASLTKQFFSYIVLTMVMDDLIDLDEPLSNYLPGYVETPYIDEVTARHVLSHTSGFPNWSYNKPLRQDFRPGQRYQYSGEGFTYLQRVVEKVVGKSLHQLSHEMIFNPLSMTHSATNKSDLELQKLAKDHDENKMVIQQRNFEIDAETMRRIHPNGSKVLAAGSMWSTSAEYMKFIKHLQHHKEIFNLMTEEQIIADHGRFSWGLGIGQVDTKWGKGYWQWGSEKGYKNFLLLIPRQDFNLVILTNGANGEKYYLRLIKELIDVKLDLN